jgi:hypothetical protein
MESIPYLSKMVGNGMNLIYAENKAKDSEDSAERKCNLCRKQG